MVYDFSAKEIFEMAIRIEENGGQFYRKAAGLQSDEESRTFLEKLAAMEDRHAQLFQKMQVRLADKEKASTVFDPNDESSQYLAAMADAHGGEGSPTAADALTGEETLKEIIDIAIGLEKESILFYLGLKDFVPPEYGQDKLDEIIAEERRHIIQLNAVRQKL